MQQKIEDHPAIAVALIATGDIELVEKNNWHDNFWGDCSCLRCYKIWMRDSSA